MNLPLQGRRALVTGSLQGIGLAIAETLAQQGAAVVLHGLASAADVERARAAVAKAGAPRVDALTHNLREPAQVERMVHAALEHGPVGWTETAIIEPQIEARAAALGVGRNDAIRDLLREKQPSQRTSLPGEIARVVAWLCEPAAHNLTGASIPVDGGWTAQ